MIEINIVYKNGLRCVATHEPSGTELTTDAPRDNHGMGESFSPTDLVATALGTCILTVMAIAAKSMRIDLSGARAVVRKEMVARPARRIGTLAVTIEIPTPLGEAQRQKLIEVAMTCPVHKSLHPDVQMPIDFRWA